MNTKNRIWTLVLGLCAGLGGTATVHAQDVISPGIETIEATWSGTININTTNPVVTAEYSWDLLGYECQDVVGTGPLLRDGRVFWYDFRLTTTLGEFCPSFIAGETTPIRFGELAPGDYTLITTSWGEPVMTNTFTVPPHHVPPHRPGHPRPFDPHRFGQDNRRPANHNPFRPAFATTASSPRGRGFSNFK